MTITKVLVANRGEIALRVFRTCSRLGITTVAVYTDLDADAPHVAAADEAVRIDGYLDIDAVVGAAVAVGADAVHPGYGFLSERAEFARALDAAGVRLVGPSAEVMDAMGRKDHARAIAVRAGVPVVPSYAVADDPESFAYPVLVKAAAGGGGKGMRVVRSAGEYAEALAAARREAASSFGDDTMLVERFVESGRHIEVQVLGDSQGDVVHLFERDCSTQRRHQKVLEEAPAPTIGDDLRKQITTAGAHLARHAGYTNAGTVEFLLDNATGDFYFLEMNTRLQVEHPVTESVVRVAGEPLDLVELQLRVAAGDPLGFTQDGVALEGHAIEARVYAEDSFGGFLPQAGTTSLVRWPGSVRVDQALGSNQVVSTAYDPMLGKVVAYGADREAARQALVAALDETAILGLTTNAGFLRALVASAEFAEATIDTTWLDRHRLPRPEADVPRVMAAWVSALPAALDRDHPFHADGFRLGSSPAPTLVELDRDVVVDRAAGTVDGVPVRELLAAHHTLELEIGGQRARGVVNVQPDIVEVSYLGQRFVLTGPDRLADHATVGDGSISAPMPGTLLEVRVSTGEAVEEGQVLGTLEAMKMELSLTSPFAGTVTSVGATAGSQVPLGAPLFVVERADERADD
ncbi:MAG TPA: biotin carboxylase N-terminal domain-containing protein [Nocardioides sp.]|jgi:3-methylcrotonyl-CoA carboxylase alpha subunit/acetyl-CoA/propionyl-CoA carboxylase biotin carboxyl carrier protein|uniref:acetyl/propionyl/methylcrotonyl-CoA carboxylase subunit alpha n=1 Tax=Nocardioides sp. TaxID=35761 RepID=UPI002E3299DD|nr:biotin carboxylase N-terminal domain-containing protein [Nocardioides sp.]HEX3932221.1 biotin carboxylase N-terminal domain-containing protein [Nocardioides sp.]